MTDRSWQRRQLIERDPLTGKTEWLYEDVQNPGTMGVVVFEDQAGIQAQIEKNKAMYAQTDERARFHRAGQDKGDPVRIGWVPNSVYMDLFQKSNGFKDRSVLKKFVADPANRDYLSRPFRLGL